MFLKKLFVPVVFFLLFACLAATLIQFGGSRKDPSVTGEPEVLSTQETSVTDSTSTVQKPSVATSSPTVLPSLSSTASQTPSLNPTSTTTMTLVQTITPTETRTAAARKWAPSELGWFLGHVASWFLSDFASPVVSREGDEMAVLIDSISYQKETGSLIGPVEQIDPDAACAWAFEKLQEGYGLVVVLDGSIVENKSREERWEQFAAAVGNPSVEPYCPQFDISLEIPIFN